MENNKPRNNNKPRPSNPRRQSQPRNNQRSNNAQNQNGGGISGGLRKSSRGAAIRAQKRAVDDATRQINSVLQTPKSNEADRPRANFIDDRPLLKIIGLGGMDGGGSKNTILVEYMNDAIIIDCGNDLGVDLPGINYGICDMSYLDSIKHKLRAYVITHGHLDHIGGLPHIVPQYPAPVYGSKFSIGVVYVIL